MGVEKRHIAATEKPPRKKIAKRWAQDKKICLNSFVFFLARGKPRFFGPMISKLFSRPLEKYGLRGLWNTVK